MDRRRVLVGMTAMGVAARLDLSELLSAQSIEPATRTIPARYAHLSDGERHRLLGPVKMCVEEGARSVTTSEYAPDGKLLTFRSEHDGKAISSSSDSVYSNVRDAQGRILKYSSRNMQGLIQETSYDYGKDGRLLTITNDQNSDRTEYHYRADGMTSIQTFDPKTIEQNQNIAFARDWDWATYGVVVVPMGGNVTTNYDKNANPIELQVHSADGQIVTRIVRTYDAEGRLTEERALEMNMPTSFLVVSAEQQAEMTPAQLKAYSKGPFALIKQPLGSAYTYDSQGRITGKRVRDAEFEETTTISYNEQGDKARERKTVKTNSLLPGPSFSFSFDAGGNPIISAPEGSESSERDYMPEDSDVRFSYRYDSYGNWTEKIVTSPDGSGTIRRTITYY